MIGGLGYLLAAGNVGIQVEYGCCQGYLGADAHSGYGGADTDAVGRTCPP